MTNWNLSATIVFKSGLWMSVSLTKDQYGFQSSGPVGMLGLPELCSLIEQLGLKSRRVFASMKVRMVIYRFEVDTEGEDLIINGGTMGITGRGSPALGRRLFRDQDFITCLPVDAEAGS